MPDIIRAAPAMLALVVILTGGAVAQGHDGPSIGLEKVAEGLVAPIQLTAPEDGSGHRFVVDQIGVIRILTKEGVLMERPFLDLRERIVELNEQYDERGLLGLAFHPDYADNGRFFVYYSAPLQPMMPDSFDHANRLSEFRVSRTDPRGRSRLRANPPRVAVAVHEPQRRHDRVRPD